jgi:hypothetical protein
MLNLENEPRESRQRKFLSNCQDDSLNRWSKSVMREFVGSVWKYPKSYLNTTPRNCWEPNFVNLDIYYNEKVGLATRVDLIRVFGPKLILRCVHWNWKNFLIRNPFLIYDHSKYSEKIICIQSFSLKLKVGQLPYLALTGASPIL